MELAARTRCDAVKTIGNKSAFDRPLPTTRDDSFSGSAWALVGVANIGCVDARLDPTNDQGKFGTTLKQSIPFGGRFAVTLQDTYSVTETWSADSGTGRYSFDGSAACLHTAGVAGVRQRKKRQIQHPPNRHDVRRRPDQRQQRSRNAQHAERRAIALRATPGYHRGHGAVKASTRVLSTSGRPSGLLNREKVVHNLPGAGCSAGRARSAPRPPKSHAAIGLQRGPAQFALRLVGVDHEQE